MTRNRFSFVESGTLAFGLLSPACLVKPFGLRSLPITAVATCFVLKPRLSVFRLPHPLHHIPRRFLISGCLRPEPHSFRLSFCDNMPPPCPCHATPSVGLQDLMDLMCSRDIESLEPSRRFFRQKLDSMPVVTLSACATATLRDPGFHLLPPLPRPEHGQSNFKRALSRRPR